MFSKTTPGLTPIFTPSHRHGRNSATAAAVPTTTGKSILSNPFSSFSQNPKPLKSTTLKTSTFTNPPPRELGTGATTTRNFISFQNPKPLKEATQQNALFLPFSASTSLKTLVFSSAVGFLIHLSPIPALLPSNSSGDGSGGYSSGGGRGGGRGGGGGGSGHGKGGFWSRIFSPAAIAKEEESETQEWHSHGLPADLSVQLNKLSGFKKYKVSEILFFDRVERTTLCDDPFFEMLTVRPGAIYTKGQLQKELENLAGSGLFEKVDLEGKTKSDGTIGLTVSYTESTWAAADKFRCINVGLLPRSNPVEMDPDMTQKEKMDYFRSQEKDYKKRIDKARPCLLPESEQREIVEMLRGEGKIKARLLQKINHRVQKWYHDNGYISAQVVNFGNLGTKEIVCEVVEGDITQLVVQFQDKLGNVVEGNTQLGLLKRELPKQLQQGNIFNIEVARQALRNVNSLNLFSNIEVLPRPDEKNGGIIVELKLLEAEAKMAEVSTEWSIIPGQGGCPNLASIMPGGTVSFEHRNLKGLNRSIHGSVTTSDFLNPQDDLAFKLEYVHPYLDGIYNPRNRTLRTSFFNCRKVSPVFTGGPGVDEVPPIWVDRAGIKTNITENFSQQHKFTYGLVLEEITTRDENNHVSATGQRVLPSGGFSPDGPPTTLSGTGIDRMAFAQANITRDNTKFVNGTIVGERNVFQVEQGLGIGSKFPLFNRHQLTLTRFIPLKEVEEGAGKAPPPVLVLHGHYGGCVGDLPSYDAFILGGPYSVRGYNMGEIGAARNILELAAEVRYPVMKTQVYAFAEHGNDLGSSKGVKGNPTEVYRRRGHGSSYGVGAKLGQVRAEYVIDHNSGNGSVFFRFGERF